MKRELNYLCSVGFVLFTTSIFVQDALGLGESSLQPGYSCKQILLASGAPNGVYWIDPDGLGGNVAFEVYCDMTTAGGGWMLAVNSLSSSEAASTDMVANTGTVSPTTGHTRNLAYFAIDQTAEIRHYINYSGTQTHHAKYTGKYHNPLPPESSWINFPGHTVNYLTQHYGMAWQTAGNGFNSFGAPWYYYVSNPYSFVIPAKPVDGQTQGPVQTTNLIMNQYSIYVRELPYPNVPPIAIMDGPYYFAISAKNNGITFDASASQDPNQGQGDMIVYYEWDLNNDLIFEKSTSAQTISLTPAEVATLFPANMHDYQITLRVRDLNGGTNQVSTYIRFDDSLADSDGDGVPDASDGCPSDPDKAGPGQCGCSVADSDSDGDGVADCVDAFPDNPAETIDSDGDGVGDNTDIFPNDPAENADTDGDGFGNNGDNCPTIANLDQTDSDGNGFGDACNRISYVNLVFNSLYAQQPVYIDIDETSGEVTTAEASGDISGLLTETVVHRVQITSGDYAGWGFATSSYDLEEYQGTIYTVFYTTSDYYQAWSVFSGDLNGVFKKLIMEGKTYENDLTLTMVDGAQADGVVEFAPQQLVTTGTTTTSSNVEMIFTGTNKTGTASGYYSGNVNQSESEILLPLFNAGFAIGNFCTDIECGSSYVYLDNASSPDEYKRYSLRESLFQGIGIEEHSGPVAIDTPVTAQWQHFADTSHHEDYFLYSKLDTGTCGGSYGVEGFVGADGTDRIIFYTNDDCDGSNWAKAKIYTVTIAENTDPNMHPNNSNAKGVAAPRTFTLEKTFLLHNQNYSHDHEFYVGADGFYFGAAFATNGIEHYDWDGNYLGNIVSEAAPGWPQSLAFDGVDTWYAGDGSGEFINAVIEIRKVYKWQIGVSSAWEEAFSYMALPGSDHHDGMEFIDGYLNLVDYMGNHVLQFDPTISGLNYPENIFWHEPLSHEVEGMGFGALNHFWVGSHETTITEFGGGTLQIVPVDSNVTVTPTPNLSVTFNNVTSEGNVSAVKMTNPSQPGNYRLATIVYDLIFSGTFEGPATVCINYDEGDVENETNLKLLHWENSSWQDITSSVDTVNNVVCGETMSFSPFVVGEPVDGVTVHLTPYASALASIETDRVVTFNGSRSGCYEEVGGVLVDLPCSYSWDFGGAGAVLGGNGIDVTVYQYAAVGTYIATMTMTEPGSGLTATVAVTAKAIEVEPPAAGTDFATAVNGRTVTLTALTLPANVVRAYIYWGDRLRTVSTNPQADLATGISYTYARGGRDYNIRVQTIDVAHHLLDYTFTEDGDLSVTLP